MKLGKKLAVCLLSIAMLAGVLGRPMEAWAVDKNKALAQGVDVSKHNGAVDWQRVADAGMKFALIKAGSTNSGIDPNFDANMKGAQAAGLRTGVYIYSYATTPEQAIEEANLVLQWIDGYTVNFPVVFDFEHKTQKKLNAEQMIAIINSFCMTIDAAGYYPMVYSYKNMFDGKLTICGWDRWVAHYSDSCGTTNNVCIWQYSSKGRIPGFGGNVDLNYQFKDYSSLIVAEGFVSRADGNVRFYRNWRMQRGWVDYNGGRYYLDGAGNLVRGWYTDEAGTTYYLSPADGRAATGICELEGQRYYFDAAGVLIKNQTLQLNEGTFIASPEGYLLDVPPAPADASAEAPADASAEATVTAPAQTPAV